MSKVFVLLLAAGVAGCSEPEIERPGTWKPTGINDRNLRAMLVTPQDAYNGTGAMTARGDSGSRAVTRLLSDRRRALIDATASRVAVGGSAPADSGPPPSSGSGGPQ